jgi:hypothetical protein
LSESPEDLLQRSERYRTKAEECRARGDAATMESVKRDFYTMAQSYEDMAKNAELIHRTRQRLPGGEDDEL